MVFLYLRKLSQSTPTRREERKIRSETMIITLIANLQLFRPSKPQGVRIASWVSCHAPNAQLQNETTKDYRGINTLPKVLTSRYLGHCITMNPRSLSHRGHPTVNFSLFTSHAIEGIRLHSSASAFSSYTSTSSASRLTPFRTLGFQ